MTSALGPFRLQQVKGGKKGLRKHINSTLKDLRTQIGSHHDALYLVGGSWRAIARLDMERRGYPLKVLHEYEMSTKSIRKTLDWIDENSVADLRGRTGISNDRMSLVPLASQVLRQLVHVFGPKKIFVSSYGIREGILYEQMPQPLRARDPLIEACSFMEKQSARIPGFGAQLYAFLRPLFRSRPPARRRLIRAACLLHDVNWRAHPDYRADACFDTATRANLGSLEPCGPRVPGDRADVSLQDKRAEPAHPRRGGVAVRRGTGRRQDHRSRHAVRRDVHDGPSQPCRRAALFPKESPGRAGSVAPHGRALHEVAEQRFRALATQLRATPKVRVARAGHNSKGSAQGAARRAGAIVLWCRAIGLTAAYQDIAIRQNLWRVIARHVAHPVKERVQFRFQVFQAALQLAQPAARPR